uniref:Uncharacterized protein n=1 Tax=Lotharella globosa TaxID=91324 RepID=A0A7S3Z8J1_9EUKA
MYPSSESVAAVMEASREGKTARLMELLEWNPTLANAKDDSSGLGGLAPLHWAAMNNRVEVVELLVRRGASIDTTDCSELTPIHYAVEAGHNEVASSLLRLKASVDAKDQYDQTPLHTAAASKLSRSGEAIRTLVSHGATLDARRADGFTPLCLAVYLGREGAVSDLLMSGADPRVEVKGAGNAFQIAEREHRARVGAVLRSWNQMRALDRDLGMLHMLRGQISLATSEDNDDTMRSGDRWDYAAQCRKYYAASRKFRRAFPDHQWNAR